MILSLLAIFSWCVLGTNMVLAKLRPKELAAVNRRLATIPDRVGGVNLAFVEYGQDSHNFCECFVHYLEL